MNIDESFDLFKKEGNELIARFLGCDNSMNADGSYELYQYLECIEDGENEQHFFLPEDMKFHESFDWLMPVVDEIGNIVYRVEEGKSWKTDYSYYELLAQISYKTSRTYIINDKESLWLSCVEWIKWYNNDVSTDFTNNYTVQELQSKIMKSELKNCIVKNFSFPCLMIRPTDGIVVLFTHNEKGTCVYNPETGNEEMGYHSENWDMSDFSLLVYERF